MKVRLTNGSLFQLIGSDNIDSLMGTNPKIVVFSEYALQDPAAWDYIRPILKVNGGVAIFISTPRGRNHFWELFRSADSNPGWWAQKLTILDTGVLTAEDVEQEKREGMSDELAQQEYYCSFDRGVEGSYYAKLMAKMYEQERICPIPYDPSKMVHCSFDLGWDDCTSVIFFQKGGDFIKIIDCEERSNTTLSEWKKILMDKGYKYGYYLFPFDVEYIDGLGSGCTRREILENLQIPVTTVPKALIADGIETVKALLSSQLMINSTKCQPLIKAMESYHKDWDDKHKVYSNKPRHDWSSHFCDSLRYMAQGLSLLNSSTSVESDYKAARAYFGM
jgi:phage terminase large subunit